YPQVVSAVTFPGHTQAPEGQVGIDDDLVAAVHDHRLGETPGGNERRLCDPGLLEDPLDQAVDEPGVAVDQAGLDRLDGAAADGVDGSGDVHAAERRCGADQGVDADQHSGGDGAAPIVTVPADQVHCGGSAEVDGHD